jgi:ribosomal protein S18 acetylase RimI-like enzyme
VSSLQALANSKRSAPPSVSRARKLSPCVLVFLNEIGIALYEKFGFEIEGTHRRYAFRDGEYADAYSMARVRD